jgi:hypothetical protein
MYILLGVINLTSIDFVNIRDKLMMKAIGRMCPHLKEVTFSEWLHTDAITPAYQLFAILTTEWPKVKCLNNVLNVHQSNLPNLISCRLNV